MNRVICCALLIAVAGTIFSAAPAPAATRKVECSKRSGDTLYRDRTLRVFRKVKPVKGDPDAETVRLSFCTPGTRKTPVRLTTFANNLDESLTVSDVRRAGSRHLTLDIDESTGTADGTSVWVYDITTRRRTFAYGSESAFEYVVTGDGGVALLEAGNLTAFDAAGRRALATGASALASSRNVVYWTANGAAQSATLTGEGRRDI